MTTKRECSVADCDAATRSSGATLCERHYYRLRRTGTTERLRPWARRKGQPCQAADCSREQQDGDYCDMHAARYRRHGSPDVVITPPERCSPSGSAHPMWSGDRPTYNAAHQRVEAVRGSARSASCVDCQGPARHWSYGHRAECVLIEDGKPYSADPADYDPRCVPCHKRFDLSIIAERAS